MSDSNPVPQIVTIDGPAASGKTSVSRELARRLGWNWVSTGAFYRGLAYVAQELKLDLKDEKVITELAHSKEWHVEMDTELTRVIFRGQDVTKETGAEHVGSAASIISQYPKVRERLLPLQRECAQRGAGLIAEGRDCGSVVFPGALLKVYITARSEDRAQRRALEHGKSVDIISEAQKKRDQADQQRSVAPLQIPVDSLVLDTSDMSLDQVVSVLEEKVRRQLTR